MKKIRTLKFIAVLFALFFTMTVHSKICTANDDDLTKKLDKITDVLQSYFNQVDASMTQAAKALANTDLSSPKAHSILADLCRNWSKPTIECVTINSNGIIAAVEPPEFQKFQGADYSKRPQVSIALDTKKPFISKIFKPHDPLKTLFAVSYLWPIYSDIYSKKNVFVGTVGVFVRPVEWLDSLVLPELGADTYDVWILATDGTFMYSRYHKEIGEDLLIVSATAAGSSLTDLVKQITANPSGKSYFTLPPTGKAQPMSQPCIWKTVKIRDIERRVAIFGSREAN